MRVGLALLLALFMPIANGAGSARARLDAFARGLDAVSAQFTQTVHDPSGREVDGSTGTLALKAPRLFRWQYEQPFPQLIVADGNNVWIYDEDLEQVTVRAQSAAEAQSPLTVLTDLSLLEREFVVGEGGETDGLAFLMLKPRAEEASFQECRLGFAADGLALMLLIDNLGQRNEIRFSDWKRNPALSADAFTFDPPAGVDVVGEPVDSAEAFPIRD